MERKALAPILIFGFATLFTHAAGFIGKSLQATAFVNMACILENLLMVGLALAYIVGITRLEIMCFNDTGDCDYLDFPLPDEPDALNLPDRHRMQHLYDRCIHGEYMSRKWRRIGLTGRLRMRKNLTRLEETI